jgi:hypothetical protein
MNRLSRCAYRRIRVVSPSRVVLGSQCSNVTSFPPYCPKHQSIRPKVVA